MSKIFSEINALALIADYASRCGLPEPTNFGYDHHTERLVLHMAAVADIRAWAEWMPAELHSEHAGRHTLWSVTGTLLDAKVKILCHSINATNVESDAVGLPVGGAA